MKSFVTQISRLVTLNQQHAFAKLVPNKLRRLNPHHPRIHHTDSPKTVVGKALTVQHTATSTRRHKARRKRTRKTRIAKAAILVMLATTLALVLSHSRSSGSTNDSAPAKKSATKHVVSPTTSSKPKPPPAVVAPKPHGSHTHHKSHETQVADELIRRMNKHLPTALDQLNRTGKKSGHWAWWAFPTNREGNSEPSPKTRVYASTAKYIIDNAPYVWRQILEKVCQLVEKSSIYVLPHIDHGRVKFFAKQWLDCPSTPHWLRKVCVFLKGKYK